MLRCSACQTLNDDSDVACSDCGTRLTARDYVAPSAGDTRPLPRENAMDSATRPEAAGSANERPAGAGPSSYEEAVESVSRILIQTSTAAGALAEEAGPIGDDLESARFYLELLAYALLLAAQDVRRLAATDSEVDEIHADLLFVTGRSWVKWAATKPVAESDMEKGIDMVCAELERMVGDYAADYADEELRSPSMRLAVKLDEAAPGPSQRSMVAVDAVVRGYVYASDELGLAEGLTTLYRLSQPGP